MAAAGCAASGSITPVTREAERVQVLVVEDEVRLANALKRGLAREGFAVAAASDGETALWLASEGVFDVIVLDIMLPKLNGFEVCARLRAAEIWTPILMLTAKDGELDHAEALDTGADDFLVKPFSYLVLVAHLRALVRRGTRVRPTVLEAGDLRLDPAAHECWRGDTRVDLTARQFALLEFLLRRKGEVLSKTEILDHVWDYAFDGDLNNVEVYVRYLRKKIDEPFGRKAIETIRLVGYRLEPDGG
jgi:DNA-binding response OmpR family regulator